MIVAFIIIIIIIIVVGVCFCCCYLRNSLEFIVCSFSNLMRFSSFSVTFLQVNCVSVRVFPCVVVIPFDESSSIHNAHTHTAKLWIAHRFTESIKTNQMILL